MNILSKIVATKKAEVSENKGLVPIKKLEQSIYFDTPTVSLSGYVTRPDKAGIIAEFKHRSPSKPNINLYANPKEVSLGYMQAGASAISVLTDKEYFGGSAPDLNTIRKYNYCPILRKDFIIDEYQILEARSMGADAILLIAEILTAKEVDHLSRFAHSLGLEVLMELHSEDQLDKIADAIKLIGVNNRNLDNFITDINFSFNLLPKLPKDMVKISESGLNNPQDAARLKMAGFDGFLIGEHFMLSSDPGKACQNFITQMQAAL